MEIQNSFEIPSVDNVEKFIKNICDAARDESEKLSQNFSFNEQISCLPLIKDEERKRLGIALKRLHAISLII